MKSEVVSAVCLKLVEFSVMDNSEKSARNYANDLLSNMELFWRGKLVDGLLVYLTVPTFSKEPRKCVKSLRVFHELTTHCSEWDLNYLAMNTNILHLLKELLETPNTRELIIRTSLSLISNLILAGWRIRDAIIDKGILKALLKLMNPHRKELNKYKALLAQIIWLLYQLLRYKVPGPKKSAIMGIAVTLSKLLVPNRDVDILLPLLRLARLVSEYNSVMLPVMIHSGLLSRVAPFVLSPLTELKREAIFVLANSCMQPCKRRKHLLYRFPKRIILYINDLFLSGPVEIRVMILQLLGGIIDNRCIRTGMMLRLIPKVIQCASGREQEAEVRSAAGWTLASLAMHLEPKNFPIFIRFSGYHVLCQMLHTQLPVQLLRNVLCVLLKLIECYPAIKPFLISVMWQSDVWPILKKLLDSGNAAVRTLATLLDLHGERDVCWVDVLGN
ncbi:uncharacterized protein [Drosophila takahashii]|uniref:uncharacterized protein n=1 Tax=Drosophila takahashii TaxID=29030 RepID=UPI001CF7EE46|nr:uncharacterized protein LOC108062019 [Drosophila takahashii]